MEAMKLQKRMPVSAMLDPKIVLPALGASVKKLDPRLMIRNPVMFVVEVVAALTTVIFLRDLVTGGENLAFTFQIILWLWFTVLFANFAEAVAEGRGKAQAESLKKTRTDSQAKLLTGSDKTYRLVPGTSLKVGDIVLVEAGDNIPSDGEVIEGVASVNEAAITGESAPVIRESGGDRSAVTGGTQVLSDWIRVRITAAQGSTFIDRMIKLVEGAERQKTPNEIALNILLAGLTIIFVFATVTIPSYAAYAGGSISVVVLVALFVTLIPTTIGALLSAIGIAGMDRLVRFNVLALSGRADRGRNQGHEQRHQDHHRDGAAGISHIARNRDRREHEDDGQADQEDIERDLVRRLLPLGAFDQPDHAVEEGRAERGSDAHFDPVGEHLRAAGDSRTVAAGFADDRRRLAGDGRFVDRPLSLIHILTLPTKA
jgi:hypothetical protein